jgi:hypothetical protein
LRALWCDRRHEAPDGNALVSEYSPGVVLVRCPSCGGLRGVTTRNADSVGRCRECRKGRVVPVSAIHEFWTERFTMEEIRAMGKAIWG